MGHIETNPQLSPLFTNPDLLVQAVTNPASIAAQEKEKSQMSDVREKLKPYLNKRIQVRGTLAKWDTHWKTGLRQTGRACITNPEIATEVVCDHVWVGDVPHWEQCKEAVGSQIVFDAIVQSYLDKSNGKTNYRLGNASDPTFLHQPPCLAIPEPPTVEEIEEDSTPDKEVETLKDSSPVSSGENPMEKIRQVKVFAKTCGNFEKAEKVLAVLPPMPLSEVLEYIKALKE